MATLITTADLPEFKRFSFWQQAVCDTFLHLDCVRTSDHPFAGEISTTRVGQVGFSRVFGRAHKVCRTPHQIRRATEEFLLIAVELTGTCLYWQDGREATLEAGDFACFDSTRPYSARLCGDCEQLIVQLPRDMFVRKLGQTEPLTARVTRGSTPMGALVRKFVQEAVCAVGNLEPAMAERLSEATLCLVGAAMAGLVSEGVSKTSGRISLVCRAKAFIEENLHDPELAPEAVAGALRISVRYLHDLFRDEDVTVSNWIWARRLEKCRRDLSDSLLASKSVSEIAFACGFSDFSHFAHRFKARFSLRPSDIRRQMQVVNHVAMQSRYSSQ
jgi:AraC-like DNA-binding protein